jgi:hypothetical protein
MGQNTNDYPRVVLISTQAKHVVLGEAYYLWVLEFKITACYFFGQIYKTWKTYSL